MDLGIFCAQPCSRTRRTQRCTRDLWGKPRGRDNYRTNPPNDSSHGAYQGWCAGRLCSSPGSPEALLGVPRVKHMTRRAFSWQSNAQRVIRRRDPFRGTDCVAMYGSAAVFGTFLWIQPSDFRIIEPVRRSRTRRTQRCTPDLWGKPGGRDNCGTNPPNDSPHGAHQGWCAGRLCSSPG